MAWTAPRTWVDGEVVNAAMLNAHVRDNLRILKGLDGVIPLESAVEIPEQSAPSTPASGFGRMYFDTSGLLSSIDDAGAARALVKRASAATANRVAYWSSASEISHHTNLTYDDATGRLTVAGGVLVPRSGGTAIFAIDASATGAAITLANLTTSTPFDTPNNFSGLVLIRETATDGSIALFITGAGLVTELADPSGHYSNTSGTASSTNFYRNGTTLTLENRRGGSRTYNVMAIRIGTSN